LLNAIDLKNDKVSITYSRARGAGLILGFLFFVPTYAAISGYVSDEADMSKFFYSMLVLLPIDLIIFLVLFTRINIVFDNKDQIRKTFFFVQEAFKE
jgi:drug/metabolite transporter (DMT)-like permease